jgi:UDP-N-acetylglucosamine pyrophosphorylase
LCNHLFVNMLEDKLSQIKKSLEKIASYTQKMGGVSLDETQSQIDSDIIFQNLLSELNIPPLAQKEQISSLKAVDQFYQPIGGLLGYYRQALQLLIKEPPIGELKSFSRAPGFDIEKKEHQALMEGLQALPYLILMYPIGGLASRLDFKHPSGQTAPAALLPFMGRSLLEGLIRDVQALEMVYERFFAQKIVMPIAMMTSDENEQVILDLLEQMHYFGRPKDLFWLFKQPSVPVVDEQGSWVFASDLSLMMQPGGHGAIWQAAKQQGVLQNMHKLGKKYLLVRQINNPIAGMDHALLSLIGLGCRENKAFGFLSCERDHTAAEGALALIHDQQGYKISNLEYTQLVDLPNEGLSTLSANTNILFVDLEKIAPVFEKSPLNGFLLNMKQTLNPHENKKVGRLETMMQGVSDQLMAESIDQLPVFVAYQKRLKTIASTKKRFTGSLQETPEGAYYHYYLNH